MKHLLRVIMAYLLFTSPSHAASTFANVTSGPPSEAIFIIMDAEYVAAELTITNTDKDPDKRKDFINQARNSLKEIIKNSPHSTKIHLTTHIEDNNRKNAPQTNETKLIYKILVSLQPFNNDFFDAAYFFRGILTKLPKIEDTIYSLSAPELTIENPERYRDKILNKIVTDIRNLKNVFGDGFKIKISGLSNPVEISYINDLKVALFIRYKIEFIETSEYAIKLLEK